MQHHYAAYGFWAPAIGDYTAMRIMDWDGTQVTGMVNPGFEHMALQNAKLNPKDWTVHFEVESKDAALGQNRTLRLRSAKRAVLRSGCLRCFRGVPARHCLPSLRRIHAHTTAQRISTCASPATTVQAAASGVMKRVRSTVSGSSLGDAFGVARKYRKRTG